MFSDKKPRIIPRDESNTLSSLKVNNISREDIFNKKENIKEKKNIIKIRIKLIIIINFQVIQE